jgi:hypothetical protein
LACQLIRELIADVAYQLSCTQENQLVKIEPLKIMNSKYIDYQSPSLIALNPPTTESSEDKFKQKDQIYQAQLIAELARKAAQQDIDKLKAMGQPIYYEENGKLIREEADGRKVEYRLLLDGSEEIVAEIK